MSSDESESSLEDGSNESSFQCLRRFFLFLLFFLLGAESDDDISDKSDDDGSGSRFNLCLCFSLRFELIESFDLRLVELFLIESQYSKYFRAQYFPAEIIF